MAGFVYNQKKVCLAGRKHKVIDNQSKAAMGGSALLFPIMLLALLAALSYWVNLNVQPPTNKGDANKRHDPDYFLDNFVNTQTTINGTLRYKLSAKKMLHYPDDDSTDLVFPVYTQYENGKQYLQVQGKIGQVSSQGKDIKIYQEVIVRREPYGDKGLMTVETEYLNILPEEDIVLTQKPVVIKQAPKTVVHANGMVYDKKNLTVTLLNKVRAHYEKPVARKKRSNIDTLAAKKPKNTQKEISQLKAKTLEPHNLPSSIAPPNNLKQQNKRIRRRYD